MGISEDQLKKQVNEAMETVKSSNMPPEAARTIRGLVDSLEVLLREMRFINLNKNDFSGEVKVQKAKNTELQKEVRQKDLFLSKLIMLISEKIKVINAEANKILDDGDGSEKSKQAAKEISKTIRELVEQIANQKGAA